MCVMHRGYATRKQPPALLFLLGNVRLLYQATNTTKPTRLLSVRAPCPSPALDVAFDAGHWLEQFLVAPKAVRTASYGVSELIRLLRSQELEKR